MVDDVADVALRLRRRTGVASLLLLEADTMLLVGTSSGATLVRRGQSTLASMMRHRAVNALGR